jgi:hypothetical protein
MRWELGKDMAQRPSETNKSVQTAATWGVPVAGRVRLSQVPSRTFRALLRVRPVQAAMSHRADGRLPNAECASEAKEGAWIIMRAGHGHGPRLPMWSPVVANGR